MFSVKVKLKEGKNDFVITAVNSLGKKTEVKKTIEFTVDKPTITITKCPPVVNVDSAVIEGKVTDVNDNYSKIAVTLNNAPIELNNYNDMFSVKVKLKEGKNDFVITAVNSLGKKTEVKRTIEFTADKPTITITKCPPVVNEDEAVIEGKVTDVNDSCSKITVTLNDTPIALNEWNDMFSQRVKLKEGENEFIIAAVNSLGKRSEEKRIIKFKVLGPTIEIIKCPASVTSDTAVIEAKVTDTVDSYSALTVTVNEIPVSLNNWNNMFSREVSLREGENEIIIKATNSLGKTTIEKRTVVFDVAAPSLDLTYCPVISHQEKIAITGKVNDDRDEIGNLYLEINNERVTTDSSGNWSKELALQPGENQINIKVTNGFGKVKEENRVITYRTENSEAELKTE